MSSLFSAADYAALTALVFRPDYPGNATARGVVEAPNGDGYRDEGKRYAHVSSKNLALMAVEYTTKSLGDYDLLRDYHIKAYRRAITVAQRLQVPEDFMPRLEFGALRVLEYPPGAGSATHTDFDLFTINCYRNVRNQGLGEATVHIGEIGELVLDRGAAEPHYVEPLPVIQQSIVYFAIPDHAAVLPGGITVGDWIAERIARSRVQAVAQ